MSLDLEKREEKNTLKFVRLANCELRHISSIRHLLSTDATKILVSAFALSHLDYCSYLLSGCPQYLLNYQKVQNNAARLVLRVSKTDHLSPRLVSLHLIHEYRTDSLLFVCIDIYHVSAQGVDERMINVRYYYSLYYNCLTLNASVYITKLETVYKPTRQLRSSDTSILCLTSVHTHSLGQMSFSYAAPSVWNSLLFKLDHQTLNLLNHV